MAKSKSSTAAPEHQFPRHLDADKAISLYVEGLDAAVGGAGFGGEHLEALKKIHRAFIDRDALAAALRAVIRECVRVDGYPEKGKGRTDAQQAAMDAARDALGGL